MIKIVCAANKLIETNEMILGIRHFDDRMNFVATCVGFPFKNQDVIQGFIANDGKFYNRKDAYVIAKDANQIVRKEGGYDGDELFSEDLY